MRIVTCVVLDDDDFRPGGFTLAHLKPELADAETSAHIIVHKDRVLANRTGGVGEIIHGYTEPKAI